MEKKLFFKYTSLNILGMIGLSCYILADTFFVANGVGADGLAALNLAIPVYSIINGSGLMIGIGGATKFSLTGENNAFVQSLYFTLAAAIVFTVSAVFSEDIALLLGANEETFSHTSVYLKTILLFSPMFLLNNCMLAFVRNDKNPSLASLAMLLGSFSNVALDYIFVYPLKMGMFGAAFATGIAPVISLAVLLGHLKKRSFHFKFSRLKISEFKSIAALGISAFISEISSGIVIIVFNLLILGTADNTAVAAYGIIANISLVVISIFTGISQGIQPIVSSDKNGNALKFLKYACVTAVAFSVIIYTLGFFFAEDAARLFDNSNNVRMLEIASNGMRLYFISFFFAGINIVCSAFLAACGKSGGAFAISFSRGFAVIIPTVILLSKLFGLNGIWLSATLAELVVLFASIAMFKKIKRDNLL